MLTPRAVGIVTTVLAAAVFAFPAYAGDFQGGPCEVGVNCTVSRAGNFSFGLYYWLELRLNGTNDPEDGYRVACVEDVIDPNFTWQPSMADFQEGNWSMVHWQSADCTGSKFIADYGINFWEDIETPVNTSSTDDYIDQMMPIISWGSSTTTGNGSSTTPLTNEIRDKILGGSTDRFPGCFVNPFLDLIEAFNGASNGTADPQSFNIAVPKLYSDEKIDLNLDLNHQSTLTTKTDAWASNWGTFLVTLIWIAFGFFVLFDLKNIFGKRANDDA